MNQISVQYFEGIDPLAIEGVNDATVMAIISEIGLDGIKKFKTAKEFTAWLRLAPNNKISGGKVLSHHMPKGRQAGVRGLGVRFPFTYSTFFLSCFKRWQRHTLLQFLAYVSAGANCKCVWLLALALGYENMICK